MGHGYGSSSLPCDRCGVFGSRKKADGDEGERVSGNDNKENFVV